MTILSKEISQNKALFILSMISIGVILTTFIGSKSIKGIETKTKEAKIKNINNLSNDSSFVYGISLSNEIIGGIFPTSEIEKLLEKKCESYRIVKMADVYKNFFNQLINEKQSILCINDCSKINIEGKTCYYNFE